MGKVLTIDKNCILKTKIEKSENFNESIFESTYLKAAKCLEEIILWNKENRDCTESDDFNNIIAFTGERGSGKTSSMKSFMNSLEYEELKKNDISEYAEIKRNKFNLLKIIDPSLFSNKESIVEIVIAEMFKNFKDKKEFDSLNEKKELIKNFEQVYKDIQIINSEKSNILRNTYDNLDSLMDLSSAVSLKSDFTELVKKYINYMGEGGKEFLVIAIDDLDMNISVGEKMLEDIRKYLIIPNVIVLMAVKFEQLSEIVSQKFNNVLSVNYKLYKDLDLLKSFKEEIDYKTEKYLEKLIPFSRRVSMPDIGLSDISLRINKKDFNNLILNDNNDIDSNKDEKIWQIICKNFKEKLGYIIISENHYRRLITRNLRAFIDLIILLNNMKVGEEKKNLITIRKYYSDVIIPFVHGRKKREFLLDILYCYFNDLNKKSLLFLNDLLIKKKIKSNDKNKKNNLGEGIKNWVEENKLIINNSRIVYGDIITWIMMNYVTADEDDMEFIEIFKSIFTIRLLHKFYVEPIALYKNTGVDFIGDFFLTCNNINANYIIYEDCGKDTSIKDTSTSFIKLKPFLFEVKFESEKASNDKELQKYERLLRRESTEYILDKEINRFDNLIMKPLNIIGYFVYKCILDTYVDNYKENIDIAESRGPIRFIKNELEFNTGTNNSNKLGHLKLEEKYKVFFNIDLWMSVLKYLDIIIQNYNRVGKDKFCITLIERINEIYKEIFKESNYNIKIDKNNDNNVDILSEECSSTLKEFIDKAKPMIINKQKIQKDIERLNNQIENLEGIKKYLDDVEKLEGKKLSRAVGVINKFFNNMSIKKEDDIILKDKAVIISCIEDAVEKSKNKELEEAGKLIEEAINSIDTLIKSITVSKKGFLEILDKLKNRTGDN